MNKPALPSLWPNVVPNDYGIRPAGKPDECFYCRQKIGNPHDLTCVVVQQKVKVRYIFEIEVDQPWSWTPEHIIRHLTETSWCADNAFGDIKRHVEKHGEICACGCFKAEFVEVIDSKPTTPAPWDKQGEQPR